MEKEKRIDKDRHMKGKKKISLVPVYAVAPLIAIVVWNQLVYSGAMFLARNWPHYNFELGIDEKIPFVPWTVCIYLGCYLFWIVNYILTARQEKEEVYRFFCAEVMAKAICLICFLVLPTTNVRPVIDGNSIWEIIMKMLYEIDSASNLFPSIHCLVSWFCVIGIRKQEKIPWGYKLFSVLMALAVCVSTLTTKQHVFVDVIAGVVLAEVCYWISGKTGIWKKLCK